MWGLVCFFFPVGIVGLALLGRWIMRPMREASQWVQAPRRFYLADFVWLMILLQAAFAVVALVPTEERAIFVILLVFFVGSSVAVWAAATSVLSRAGIQQARRRGVFVLVVLPGVLIELCAAILWPFVVLAGSGVAMPRRDELLIWLTVVIGGFVGILLVAWLLRLTVRWIVAGAESTEMPEAVQQAMAENRSPWDD